MTEIGLKVLKKFIEICEGGPGIYKMIGAEGQVLYIGKAKNLRSRLLDYTNINQLSNKNKLFISKIEKIETVATSNEVEAILLESNLVRKIQPKYNILLKDDKSFPYIFIDETTDFPRIIKYRGKKDIKGRYFGPFASAAKVDEIIAILQKAFLIRTCSDSFFKTRHRPCMLYQIKKCSAPCVNKISKSEYSVLVNQVKDHLIGKEDALQKDLRARMKESSDKLDYEKSAIYRDRLEALSLIKSKQVVSLSTNKDFDIVAVASDRDIAVIEIFFIRDGINLGNAIYNLKDINSASSGEILAAFLFDFYRKHLPPKEILMNCEIDKEEEVLLRSFLEKLAGNKVKVVSSMRGVKKDLMDFAVSNASEALRKRYYYNKAHKTQFESIRSLLNIDAPLSRIEIYDNSHFSGDNAVGVMVVCEETGLNKSEYKKFNIRSLNKKPDDYEMFREVMTRRFKDKSNLPQLMIIDGGLGQVSTVSKVCEDHGIHDICIIGMAKGPMRNSGEETIYRVSGESIHLDKHSKVKQYLQVLRDEAHRFAITSQRSKVTKKISQSSLDDIPGIGKKRRMSLLQEFGSVKRIKEASIKELMQVDSINKKNAENIYKYFHYSL